MVRMRRLELPRREAPDPKSGVSTNSTTSAQQLKDISQSMVESLDKVKALVTEKPMNLLHLF